MTDPHDPQIELSRIMQNDRGRLLAALIASLRHFDLAEEALSDAVESALVHWGRSGIPARPQSWLLRVAQRKAIDRIRRQARWRERVPDLEMLAEADADWVETHEIPDERLRLIFTCCHPALDPKSRVALTLRTIGGLTTGEIARAFLDTEPTMGQRLSRAKSKIAATGIPYAVPGPDLWPERLGSVLTVIYLIFNEGYAASTGDSQIRTSLCQEAIFLGRLMLDLTGGEAEVAGLLSLMLTTHARRPARTGADGAMIPLDRQDRAMWDAGLMAEGLDVLDVGLRRIAPGPYQIKAAISALHGQAVNHGGTDWLQMLWLYDSLLRYEPTPVVQLNRAVVLAELGRLAQALAELELIGPALAAYQPYYAARAELLTRAERSDDAIAAYDTAISLSGTASERVFLQDRRKALSGLGKKKPGSKPG